MGPGDEELVRAHLRAHPRATQKALRELLLGERGVEVDENAFGNWARKKRLTTAYQSVRAHRVLALTGEGAEAFVEAITNPPEPNGDLRALAREAQEIPGQAEG